MRWTSDEKIKMTHEKASRKGRNEQLVFNELLKMGFNYSQIGTHYLHDYVVASLDLRIEDFQTVGDFHNCIRKQISRKYGVTRDSYYTRIRIAIEAAFVNGNINYLLDTFKAVYDCDRMSVPYKVFIMTLREKLLISMEAEMGVTA